MMLALQALKALLPSSFDSKSQTIRYALLPPCKTLVQCFVACAWEFIHELAHPAACTARSSWRLWLLIVPHVVLLVAYILQCVLFLRKSRALSLAIRTVAWLLVPLAFFAAVHSAFRASISLCCCSDLLCPMSSPDQKRPNSKACSLFLANCYWALLRKVTHFAATMGMLRPLITLRVSVYLVESQDQAAKTHMMRFLDKTK